MNKYYVYEHYKPNCDEPFWVGKGSGARATLLSKNSGRNNHWYNIVKKYGCEVRFVATNLTEIEALWLETICIKGWGRADLGEGPLTNKTDGGEGQSGWNPSKSWRQKRSMNTVGKKNPMFGKRGAAHPSFGKRGPMFGKRGKDNPNYGRSPSKEECMKRYKPIKTPLGIFENAIAASKAHNCCEKTIRNWCKKGSSFWYIRSGV
jgi:hypothetical protein